MATSVAYTNFSYHFHSETLLGKIIRLPLRLIPNGIPVHIRTGAAKGMLWMTGAHVHGCWLGTYEKDKQDFCQKLIKPGMTVFDIGANAGFYMLVFSRLVGECGRVIAFEPESDNMCLLRKHIALNKLENVSVVQAAASDISALVGFSLTGGAIGRLEKNSSYLVPTLRLDELLSDGNLALPDVIKMDVEGAEVLVLRGAKDFIEKNSCSWIVALHGDEAKNGCLSIFSEAGYILQDLQGGTIDPKNFAGDELIAIPR
jgi:FkbM family methyltransferase